MYHYRFNTYENEIQVKQAVVSQEFNLSDFFKK